MQTDCGSSLTIIQCTLTNSQVFLQESEKPRGMWVAAVSSAAPHVRSSRKPLLGDIAIGVLSGEPSNLILDLDDKGKYEVALALYSHLFPSYELCRLTPCEFWTGL